MSKVLIVDDEQSLADSFQKALTAAGYQVTTAPDGKSGLAALKNQGPFDLILLDQMMPDMSGNDVLKTIKEDAANKELKVSMLTNFGHDQMVKDALFTGATDYILKYQVTPEDLVTKVKSLIGEASKTSSPQPGQQPAK
jgi:DNA-binding response OmpR family regulator